MSYRAIAMCLPRLGTLVLLAAGMVWGQSVTVTPSPGNINIIYLQGGALPSTQNVTVKSSAAATYTTSINPTGTTKTALWLSASPDSGTLPAKVALHVNPTGLAAGTYTASVVFAPAAAVPPGTSGITRVKLTVTTPLPTLTVNPTSLTFVPNPPAKTTQTIQLTTTGGPISFTAAAGAATWLTIKPSSGVVLPGAPVTLSVTADPATLGAQVAPFPAKITLTEKGAASKTQTIAVNFTVSYQLPAVTSLWPPTGKVGAPATTITIRGTNFGAASVAKIQGPPIVPLATTYISPTVLSAVIPATQMTAGTTLTIFVSNPAPGGDSATTQDFTFTPTLDAAVNGASYNPSAAPGALITLYGDNIGPTTPASFTVTGAYVDKTLSGVGVKVDGIDAPIIYVSQHQINVQVPYGAGIGLAKTIVVTNGTNPAANGTIDITATDPGVFTVDGVQAAAINTSKATGATSVNSNSSAARVGDTITLYLTGEGAYTPATVPAPVDGYIIPPGTLASAMPVLSAPVTATIAGVNAPVTYSGPFDGGLLGVLQVDLTVPAHTTGAGVPVVINIGGIDSQGGVTIATKP